MNRTVIKPLLLFVLLASGCAFYEPAPLKPDEEWKALEGLRLADLVGRPARDNGSKAGPDAPFDYSDGLSMDEAAGLAVVLNPDLRAFRLEQGIAQGQLVSAGLLPNPDLDAKWLTGVGPWSGEINGLFNLTDALLTRGPRKEAARIRLKEVRWRIADREWMLVNKVRSAFTVLLYRDEALRLNQSQKKIATRTLTSVEARKTRGAATELDVILAEADVTEIERQANRLAGKRKETMQGLNRLLGLPPNHDTQIQKVEKPLAYTPLSGNLKALADKLRVQRPDLLAAEQAYRVAEMELRVEYRKQFPRFLLGPSAERGGGDNLFGLGFAIDIPIFNRNQGGIAAKLAERDQKRRFYIAMLHDARAELHAAWVQWKTLDADIQFYFSKVAPRLDRGLQLTQKAFKEGEIDLLQVLVFRGRVLESRRDILERLLDFHRAGIKVEQATGPAKPPRIRKESDQPYPAKDKE